MSECNVKKNYEQNSVMKIMSECKVAESKIRLNFLLDQFSMFRYTTHMNCYLILM